jgi:hypothetical protein
MVWADTESMCDKRTNMMTNDSVIKIPKEVVLIWKLEEAVGRIAKDGFVVILKLFLQRIDIIHNSMILLSYIRINCCDEN